MLTNSIRSKNQQKCLCSIFKEIDIFTNIVFIQYDFLLTEE